MGKTTVWFCDICNCKMENYSGGKLYFESMMGTFMKDQIRFKNICFGCSKKITPVLHDIIKKLKKKKKPICWWCHGIGCSYCEYTGYVSIEKWEKYVGEKYFKDD